METLSEHSLPGSSTAKALCILAHEGTAPCSAMLEPRSRRLLWSMGEAITLILMPLGTSCTTTSRINLYLLCSKTRNWEWWGTIWDGQDTSVLLEQCLNTSQQKSCWDVKEPPASSCCAQPWTRRLGCELQPAKQAWGRQVSCPGHRSKHSPDVLQPLGNGHPILTTTSIRKPSLCCCPRQDTGRGLHRWDSCQHLRGYHYWGHCCAGQNRGSHLTATAISTSRIARLAEKDSKPAASLSLGQTREPAAAPEMSSDQSFWHH